MNVADERVPYTSSINNGPQYANQTPYKKPWYKKWWIWTILGLLTVLIVCAVFSIPLFILAKNSHSLKDSHYSYSDIVSDIIAPYADTTAPSSAQADSVYKPGEICDADGLKITLEKTEDYENKDDFIQPENGRKFIRVYFNIKNETGTDKYISSYEFACYADDFKCEENIMGEDVTKLYGAISNGRSTQIYLCYEVPVNAKSIEVEYDSFSGLSSKKYSFKVK